MAVRGMMRGEALRRRMQIAFYLTLAGYLGLIGRLLYLQGFAGPTLLREAQELREQPIPLHAYRGALCDRDGNPLAISRYSGTVGFDPKVVLPDPQAEPKETEEKPKEDGDPEDAGKPGD